MDLENALLQEAISKFSEGKNVALDEKYIPVKEWMEAFDVLDSLVDEGLLDVQVKDRSEKSRIYIYSSRPDSEKLWRAMGAAGKL